MLSKTDQNNINYIVPVSLCFVFIITFILHIGTFAGLDSDFQGYALQSKQVYNGQIHYVDISTQRPPLYFYMLLPGNLIAEKLIPLIQSFLPTYLLNEIGIKFLSGKLISFYYVHLMYVGLVSSLVFYYGSRLGRTFNFNAGLWAWLFLNLVTLVQFFGQGNGNASMLYPIMGINLIAFFQILKIKKMVESGERNILSVAFILGILSGLSFLIKYNMTVNILLVILVFYLLLTKQFQLRSALSLLIVYGIGFISPVFLMLIVMKFPLKEIYQELFIYTSLYSENANNYQDPDLSTINYIFHIAKTFIKYAFLPLAVCIIAFALSILMKNRDSDRTKEVLFGKIKKLCDIKVFKEGIASWLIVYLLVELLMLLPTILGEKNYHYFPIFIPVSLLASLSLVYLTSLIDNKRSSVLIASMVLVVVFVSWYNVAVLRNAQRIISVMKWPESKLIAEIKKYAKGTNDLYTLDYHSYLYVETDKMPPMGVEHILGRLPFETEIWNRHKIKRFNKKFMWERLEAISPKAVTKSAGSQMTDAAKSFLSKYRMVGIYSTSYRGDVTLYVRK